MSHKGKEIAGSSSNRVRAEKEKVTPKNKEIAKPLPHKLKSICIISSTDLVKDVSFVMAARELGKEMATRKIRVVYNGEAQGLGATVAMTSINRRNEVLGITQENWSGDSSSKKFIFPLGRELKAQHPYERMIFMLQHSDAFIVLPGGLAVLEMFASTMLWASAKVHKKPVGFLNVNGFFDGLLAFIARADAQRFIPPEIRHLVVSAPTVSQLIDSLQGLFQGLVPIVIPVVQNTGDKRKRDELDMDLHL